MTVQTKLRTENVCITYPLNDGEEITAVQDFNMIVQEGEFVKQVRNISNSYGEFFDLKHYVVITENYNVDIVTEWEPTIEILQFK